jgi:hypothetical protein
MAWLMVMILSGCSAGNTVVRFSPVSQGAVPTATEIKDYPGALRAIASAVEKELNIDVSPVELTLYPNAYEFERGLVKDAGFNAGFARETARFAWGVGGPGKILVNEAAMQRAGWPERVRFLAHEFVHTVYAPLANGMEIGSEQWLQEGFADWVSYRILERLGYDSLERRKSVNVRQARFVRGSDAPTIANLLTFNEWVKMRVKYGVSATYSQAFLATDYLIRQHGVQSVVKYFRLYGESGDRLRNFRESFVSDFTVFNQEFASYMQSLARS